MIYFTIISTIIFFLLGTIWTQKDWMNLIIKVIFLGMSFWGIFGAAMLLGYVFNAAG